MLCVTIAYQSWKPSEAFSHKLLINDSGGTFTSTKLQRCGLNGYDSQLGEGNGIVLYFDAQKVQLYITRQVVELDRVLRV